MFIYVIVVNNYYDFPSRLLGLIIRYKDDENDIEVMRKHGELKNVLWVYIKNNRYAFSYNHETGNIEMRKASIKGDVIHTFNNNLEIESMKTFFSEL